MVRYIYRNAEDDYTAVNNAFIRDERLRPEHVGLLLIILSKPSDWRLYPDQLAEERGLSLATVRKYLKHLEDCGYIRTVKQMKERKNGLQRHRFCSDVGISDASLTLMADQLSD